MLYYIYARIAVYTKDPSQGESRKGGGIDEKSYFLSKQIVSHQYQCAQFKTILQKENYNGGENFHWYSAPISLKKDLHFFPL